MRQVWIPKIGEPDVLELREAPDPQPKKNEVLIRVKASGINFADILARMGLYPDAPKLPAVVGYEVSGVIEQLGAAVSDFTVGQRVLALTQFGGYSDVVTTPSSQVLNLPDSLSFEKAATIPVTYLTAWTMLVRQGGVSQGQTVLIHAVGGGVGQAATQICKYKGAKIIGTASVSKHARLKESGVDHCIDYHSQDFEEEVKLITKGRGVDIVLDALGGHSFRKSYRCLAPLGKLFMFGVSSMGTKNKRSIFQAVKGLLSMPRFHPIPLMNQNRSVHGINLGHLWQEGELLQTMLKDIVHLVDQGVLDPVVDRSFSFNEAAAAHQYIQDRKNFGKVLLVP